MVSSQFRTPWTFGTSVPAHVAQSWSNLGIECSRHCIRDGNDPHSRSSLESWCKLGATSFGGRGPSESVSANYKTQCLHGGARGTLDGKRVSDLLYR